MDDFWRAFEGEPDDLTGKPGERARRALRRFMQADIRPACSHHGPRVAAIGESVSYCKPCADLTGAYDRWARWPVCMVHGTTASEYMDFRELDFGSAAIVVLMCHECAEEWQSMNDDLRQRRP